MEKDNQHLKAEDCNNKKETLIPETENNSPFSASIFLDKVTALYIINDGKLTLEF